MPAPKRQPMASPQEVSEYLKVPVETLYHWRKVGGGPLSMRVGRHIRYRWSDVDTWLDQQQSVQQ
jgi:excisionase family DNA binding protein